VANSFIRKAGINDLSHSGILLNDNSMDLFPELKYNPSENLLPFDGEVYVHPGFFTNAESERYFKILLDTINWKQDAMKFYGKEVKLPRLTAWYGTSVKDYSYSGIENKPVPMTRELLEIKSRVENESSFRFNSVLLNLYRDGNDSVSWHRDNEKVLRINPVIASVSFGATRIFKFRHINNHSLVKSVELSSGTYVLMKGQTQHMWEHHIPKSKKVHSPRISLTFRILG
jgi:alkylated DNA repair dioxygenase AlkB